MKMRMTRRRLNIMQASKVIGEGRYFNWKQLKRAGAYGGRTSILNCLHRLSDEGFASQKATGSGLWKITNEGYAFGDFVPAKPQPKDKEHELQDQGRTQVSPA